MSFYHIVIEHSNPIRQEVNHDTEESKLDDGLSDILLNTFYIPKPITAAPIIDKQDVTPRRSTL